MDDFDGLTVEELRENADTIGEMITEKLAMWSPDEAPDSDYAALVNARRMYLEAIDQRTSAAG